MGMNTFMGVDLDERRSILWLLSGAGVVSAYCTYRWLRKPAEKKGPPVDFESYLKVPTENPSLAAAKRVAGKRPAPTDFESYLKVPDPQSVTEKFSSHETSDDEVAPPSHLKPVGVVYGTEFGLSREVCEKLCDTLKGTGEYWPLLMSMDDYPQGMDLNNFQALFIACSTQGEGVPPTDSRPFCSWLHGPDVGAISNMRFSVCALGDTSYTHFAQCGKDIDARLETLGATRVVSRVDVNKEDWIAIDGWINSVVSALAGMELKSLAESQESMNFKKASVDTQGDVTYSKSKPYLAEITSVTSLCSIRGQDDKNTIRVDIDLGDSGLQYCVGDSLGVWPRNDEKAVQEIIQFMGWDADQSMAMPSWHYKLQGARSKGESASLKDLLTICYDIKAPKPDILDILVEDGSDARVADPATRAKYLGERHVIDILQDFRANENSKLTDPGALLKKLRQLAPRLYPISSSPLASPSTVTLTVAVIEYEQLDKARIGVCSTYLDQRVSEGTKVPVYIYENPDFRLPDDDLTPIIMVGPGTGVAPFRAFLQQRIQSNATCGENILFFGSRRRDQDFLYGDELTQWHESGKLSLITAFSREQDEKVYVQHRLREHGELVWRTLEKGGHFYICGDGEYMSKAVESTLLSVIESHQGKGMEAAEEYVKSLVASKRLQKDVWIS
jgi:sulfite reductase (NADPH) flavoprotein alpha-component